MFWQKDGGDNQLNWAFWIATQAKYGVPAAQGVPGSGKTAICNAASRVFKRDFIQFILSTQVPEDVNGIPVVSSVTIEGTKHECVKFVKNEVMIRAMYGNTFVLLDELSHASPPVQAANQEVWLNNPPKNAMVAAIYNPAAIATNGHEFSAAVVNRMCLLDWESDQDLWIAGLRRGEFFEPVVPVLPDNWKDHARKWENYLADFAGQNAQHFDENDTFPKKEEDYVKPWRSRRSWHNAIMNMAACESVGGSILTARKLMAGFVGAGPGEEFFAWYESLGFPSAAEIFADPSRLRLPPSFDCAMSIVKSVAAYAKNRIKASDCPGDDFEKGLDFCEAVFRKNRELGVAAHGLFSGFKPQKYSQKPRVSEIFDVVNAG